MSDRSSEPAAVEPFSIAVTDEVLADLEHRLASARYPQTLLVAGREDAHRLAILQATFEHWRREYDWRRQEQELNRLPHRRAVIDGLGIHFLWQRSARAERRALLMCNGWPGSFDEYARVLAEVADCGFDVVVPTMPGYGFSDAPSDRAISVGDVASLWLRLMVDVLGYETFHAHGDDFGGSVVSRLALDHPERVAGLHVTEWLEPPAAGLEPPATPEEQQYLDGVARWADQERAYGAVAATRPQTLAFGLNDSPLGLAAWMIDKFLSWSDTSGETLPAWTPERLLTPVMLYWASQCIGPSLALYAAPEPALRPGGRVTVPTVVTVPREQRPAPPESWLRRVYSDLRLVRSRARGGHFMAVEDPDGFVAEVRSALRPVGSRDL